MPNSTRVLNKPPYTEIVTSSIPPLSTYLGHREPGSTYWYLSAAPELLALAAAR